LIATREPGTAKQIQSISDKVIFSDANIQISGSKISASGTVFAVANISSVDIVKDADDNWLGPIGLMGFGAVWTAYSLSISIFMVLLGLGMVGLGVYGIYDLLVPEHKILITSGGSTKTVIASRDTAYLGRLVALIEQAIDSR